CPALAGDREVGIGQDRLHPGLAELRHLVGGELVAAGAPGTAGAPHRAPREDHRCGRRGFGRSARRSGLVRAALLCGGILPVASGAGLRIGLRCHALPPDHCQSRYGTKCTFTILKFGLEAPLARRSTATIALASARAAADT